MRPNILPAFVLCAVILIEARAQDQTSSGFNSYSSGEGSSFESEGSGTTESGVEKVVDAMKKLSKNKSDAELSKSIKSGARQVMRSIVQKLVTHTGEKFSSTVGRVLTDREYKRTEIAAAEPTKDVASNENINDAPVVTQAQDEVKKISPDQTNEPTKAESSNTDTNTDSSLKQTAPIVGDQKSAFPEEKNALDVIGENGTSTYSQPGSDSPGEEHIDSQDKQVDASTPNGPKALEGKVTADYSDPAAATMPEPQQNTGSKNPNLNNDAVDVENQITSVKESNNNQVKSEDTAPKQTADNQEISTDTNVARATEEKADSPQSLSINVENPIIGETKAFVNSKKTSDIAEIRPSPVLEERKSISQEQSPESISANSGSTSDSRIRAKNGKKNPQAKKRYRMHAHTRNTHRSSRNRNSGMKNSHARYSNVDKHLIKRNKNKHSGQGQGMAEELAYEGPVSNAMESVLSVDAVEPASVYSRSGVSHRKRKTNAGSRVSYDNTANTDEGSSEDASGETTASVKNEQLKLHSKKHKSVHRKTKSRKLNAKHQYNSRASKAKNSNTGYHSASLGSRAMPTKTAKYERGSKKFSLYLASHLNLPNNQAISPNNQATSPDNQATLPDNQAILPDNHAALPDNHVVFPIHHVRLPDSPAALPDSPAALPDSPAALPDSPAALPDSPAALPVNDADLPEHHVALPDNETAVHQAANLNRITPIEAETNLPDLPEPGQEQNEAEEQMTVMSIRPTMPQSEEERPPTSVPVSTPRPIVPGFPSDPPPTDLLPEPSEEAVNAENITVIAQPEGDMDEPLENSVPNNALTEEVRSLESRMTVLEAAVAEVIEWIRSRTSNPPEQTSPQVTLRPAQPYPLPSPEMPVEEPEESPRPSGLHRLKQIFIPLPPPDTEAEKEIESGQPVAGLPFPLNFVVAKMLSKMAKSREHQKVTEIHPHTPVPELDIPAIEHDINRLEMELNSVPSRPSFHHRHHRMRLHSSDPNEDMKMPILGQLVASEPEKDRPGCTAQCQNGGFCSEDNTCKCPAPYLGPHCEAVDMGRFVNPRRVAESLDQSTSDLRQRAMSQYNQGFRRHTGDRRERRKLVRVLKTMLQNLATESASASSSMRKNNIADDNEYQNQGFEEIEEQPNLHQQFHQESYR